MEKQQNVREKMAELLKQDNCPLFMVFGDKVDVLADYIIANGVTFVTDNNDGGKWIPASEPPKVYRDEYGIPIPFFVYTEDKNLFITYFVDGKHWGRFGQDLKITHWMPLPEPTKGE